MGNCTGPIKDEELGACGATEFKRIRAVGYGGFGKVWEVESRLQGRKKYALKIISKAKVIAKKCVKSVLNEKQILSRLSHPFIINMHRASQDKEHLYLLMDLLLGGDLRHHINLRVTFNEEIVRFIMGCVVLALQYIHFNSIIHRDIKPQNLVFNKEGYLKLTDFGIANIWKSHNSSQNSGTPGYMAPQVLCCMNHCFSVDYYALGIIGYQLVIGKRPYRGNTRNQIRDAILTKQVQIQKNDKLLFPFSAEGIDLINRLIQRKYNKRIGSNKGISQIKKHPFFYSLDWKKLQQMTLKSPFVPKPRLQLAMKNFIDQKSQLERENELLLRRPQVQKMFEGFDLSSYSEETKEKDSSFLSITFYKERLSF